ncbi:hypothetical protein LCGC14_2267400 [marine sediment metagenome]|uniref:Lipoprotein n=1 Tax=marine sediment metagenome TaxID=412755 RepID=A0A0F9CY00_9ZZZZ
MKSLILVLVLIGLTACANMTTREKQTAVIVASVIIGAVIISANDGDSTVINNKPCHTHEKHHRCD